MQISNELTTALSVTHFLCDLSVDIFFSDTIFTLHDLKWDLYITAYFFLFFFCLMTAIKQSTSDCFN